MHRSCCMERILLSLRLKSKQKRRNRSTGIYIDLYRGSEVGLQEVYGGKTDP